MKHGKLRLRSSAFVASIGGTMLFAVVATGQERAFVEETQEVTATVTAIDHETRLLTLRGEDGAEMVVEAGEQVRNFDQIETGDQVDVMYYEALMAEVAEAPATEDTEEAGEQVVPVVLEAARAPLGAKPEGAVGMVYTAVVTIDAVDTDANVVEFTGPGGQPRIIEVQRPEMQAFIKDLSPGDRVKVTYGEALAVAVTPSE